MQLGADTAIANSIQTIKALYKQNYSGKIIVIDTDCMTPDLQTKVLGEICHGWGEIFIIHRGQITKKYLGKGSFAKFKTEYDDEQHSR